MKKFKIYCKGKVQAVFAADSKEDALRKCAVLYSREDELTAEETDIRSPVYTIGRGHRV